MSMGQLAALNELYHERQNREDWRAAVVACAIVNLHRRKEDGAIQPKDFMPWLAPKEEIREKPLTPAQTRLWFEEITLAMGGTVHPRNVSAASAVNEAKE